MNWEDLLHNTDSEIASQIFTEKLQSTISDISVKMKCRYKKQSLPWVNDNIKKLMKECDNALKLATRFKYIKYSLFFLITIIENAHGNSKTIWRQIKNNIKTRPIELKINDKILQSPIDVAQAFNHYFIESVDKIAQNLFTNK